MNEKKKKTKKSLSFFSRKNFNRNEKKNETSKMVVEKASQPPAAAADPADPAASKKKPLSKKDAAAAKEAAEAELSEEDQELKEKLDLCVQRLSEVGGAEGKPDAAALAPAAVRSLAEEVRTSTTSMTSVPKPLKFLRPHYASLCSSQEKLSAIGSASSKETAQELADVLSVLAISSGARGGREALKWRLKGKQVSKRGMVWWWWWREREREREKKDAMASKAFDRWPNDRAKKRRRRQRRRRRSFLLLFFFTHVSLFSSLLPTPTLQPGPRRRLGPRVRPHPGGRDRR